MRRDRRRLGPAVAMRHVGTPVPVKATTPTSRCRLRRACRMRLSVMGLSGRGVEPDGARGGTRTPDAHLRTVALYPLSYTGIPATRGSYHTIPDAISSAHVVARTPCCCRVGLHPGIVERCDPGRQPRCRFGGKPRLAIRFWRMWRAQTVPVWRRMRRRGYSGRSVVGRLRRGEGACYPLVRRGEWRSPVSAQRSGR